MIKRTGSRIVKYSLLEIICRQQSADLDMQHCVVVIVIATTGPITLSVFTIFVNHNGHILGVNQMEFTVPNIWSCLRPGDIRQ
jgi:hypothetical protein